MATTPENVGTKAQLDVLRAYGCRKAQGFLFGTATPAREADRLVHARLRAVGTAA